MVRVTIDTDVFVSGLNYRGNPHRIVKLAEAKDIVSVVSEPILGEVERILKNRFGWTDEGANAACEDIRWYSVLARPVGSLNLIPEDPDDNRILECAVAGSSNYIVSGDKDLTRLGSLGPIRILKPAEFLALKPVQ